MRLSVNSFIFLALMLPAAIYADSWAPPTARIFSSENGKYLLYVAPKALKSFPELPEDSETNDKERKALGLNQECWGSLFAKNEEKVLGFPSNSFDPVWQQQFVNEIAPMSVFISNDGKFVVTTDDYGRLGDGENVVVIYDAEGKLIHRYSLAAFLSNEEIEKAPQSVSSIYWAGSHQFVSGTPSAIYDKKGIVVIFWGYDDYEWSDRKAGPDRAGENDEESEGGDAGGV